MSRLKIEYVPTESLKTYANNAKIHTTEQVEQIKKSIKDFSFNDPIGVWHDAVVEGHGRLLAAQELGMKEVPIIRLDHMTDEERKAYMLVHNQLTMNTGFEEKLLEDELMSLDVDLSEFGLALQKEYGEKPEPEEKPEVPFTQVLGEENNYIVLKFTDEVDWLQVQTLFGLETVKAYSTRKDGFIADGMERCGVGRVVDGVEFLNKMGVEV